MALSSLRRSFSRFLERRLHKSSIISIHGPEPPLRYPPLTHKQNTHFHPVPSRILQSPKDHWKTLTHIALLRPTSLRCMSTFNPTEAHGSSSVETQVAEDKAAWVRRMRDLARTKIIPGEVQLIVNIEPATLTVNPEFLWKALKLFFFDKDERSRRLVRRWKQVGRDTMNNRQDVRQLNKILGNAIERYSMNPESCEDEIKIKEGEDPVLVALRLYELRENLKHDRNITERLIISSLALAVNA
ncbi:hypothetical protein C8R41DRAFT_137510 [Lentinula lateritia]|uniref:Uncharacterized protein n=1 Tax=Lentinula lateritia TaxID=40482 RepID=A0ABQ8VQ53_9AGAR|nr:hypothetical protein C8R41DRAFT_137510 [Lentinula lateritia]